MVVERLTVVSLGEDGAILGDFLVDAITLDAD